MSQAVSLGTSVNRKPPYPLLARQRGQQGLVVLRVQVGPDGQVANLAVQRSSGYALLDAAAEKAVVAWRFVPAQGKDGPIASDVFVPVEFRLR